MPGGLSGVGQPAGLLLSRYSPQAGEPIMSPARHFGQLEKTELNLSPSAGHQPALTFTSSHHGERDGVNSWWPTSAELPVIGLSELDLVIWGQHTALGGPVKIFVSPAPAEMMTYNWWEY